MSTYADQANEGEFISLVQKGDPTAIEHLFKTYFDRLYSLVFNQVGRRQEVAEDIIQETFLSALKSACRFRGQSKPYTWLCSIAHHKVVDFYRRQQKESRRRVDDIEMDTLAEQANLVEPPAERMLESEETRQCVEQAMGRLPPEYRQVLLYKYVEDMSVAEIGSVMRRSAKSIEGLLTRGRRALHEALGGIDEG
jgi:RNA polymerase sigma-70 factor (ECF subfamily)